MIDIILISLVVLTFIILFLFWYAKYTSKLGLVKTKIKMIYQILGRKNLAFFSS